MLRAFVNCAMVLKKHLNFFSFQWEKVDQVLSEYLRSYLNWLHNWQLKSTRRSLTLKGSQLMRDGRILIKPRRDDSFQKVLSDEPNFSRIHLAGQYLNKHLYILYSDANASKKLSVQFCVRGVHYTSYYFFPLYKNNKNYVAALIIFTCCNG